MVKTDIVTKPKSTKSKKPTTTKKKRTSKKSTAKKTVVRKKNIVKDPESRLEYNDLFKRLEDLELKIKLLEK